MAERTGVTGRVPGLGSLRGRVERPRTAGDVEKLQARVEAEIAKAEARLRTRLDDIAARLDAAPRAEPPDLSGVEREIAALRERVTPADLSGIQREVKSLGETMTAIRRSLAEGAPLVVSEAAPPAGLEESVNALAAAVADLHTLLEQGNALDADHVAERVVASLPQTPLTEQPEEESLDADELARLVTAAVRDAVTSSSTTEVARDENLSGRLDGLISSVGDGIERLGRQAELLRTDLVAERKARTLLEGDVAGIQDRLDIVTEALARIEVLVRAPGEREAPDVPAAEREAVPVVEVPAVEAERPVFVEPMEELAAKKPAVTKKPAAVKKPAVAKKPAAKKPAAKKPATAKKPSRPRKQS